MVAVRESLFADLELALAAVREAGAAVMRRFGQDQVVTEKSPGQPLTEADLDANRILHRMLVGERPGYGWLSEESRDRPDRLERRRVWIVDPIDGTRSFIAGLPEFAISVGLAEEGRMVAGVVYNPAMDEVFWAVRDEGAYARSPWDGPAHRLEVGRASRTDPPVLLASRSEIAAGELEPFAREWQLRPTGSTAYKLARVAAGSGDVFVSRGPKSEWDVCAGGLLVEEAGGRATDLDGRELRYNRADPYVYGIVASNDELHAYVLGVLRTLRPVPRERARAGDRLHPGTLEESS